MGFRTITEIAAEKLVVGSVLVDGEFWRTEVVTRIRVSEKVVCGVLVQGVMFATNATEEFDVGDYFVPLKRKVSVCATAGN